MTIAEMQREILAPEKGKGRLHTCPQLSGAGKFWRSRILPAIPTGSACRRRAAAQRTLLMCGVRFMAETVKLLSPEKRVLLANSEAGCPMAEQMDKPLIEALRAQYPDYAWIAYINTTAETKTSATSRHVLLRRAGRPPNEGRENPFPPTAIWAIMWRSRSPKRPSSSFRAAVPSTPG